MGWKTIILAILIAITAFLGYRCLTCTKGTLPKFDTDKYWGPGDGSKYVEDKTIRPFKINYQPEVISDLKAILDRPLRLQDPLEDVGFEYGFNSKKVKSLVDYWRNEYLSKWETRQEYLNKFKHYTTQLNGLKIHFIHEKPKDSAAVGKKHIRIPLLLLHGWPGSVREFYEIIPKLVTPSKDHSFVFDVVAPSLVGYGFSSAAAKKGFVTYEMAIVMRNLMLRLGYDRFIVQGGDWGSIIGSQLVTLFPENAMAYHSNMCVMMKGTRAAVKSIIASIYPSLFVPKQYKNFHFPLMEKLSMLIEESGYFHLQATKPDTIGVALSSNPIGLAVYILEKFSTLTDFNNRQLVDGGLDKLTIPMDSMLDNIMIYYLTNTFTSSVRFYAESMSLKQMKADFDNIPSRVPMGCARFKHDLPPAFDWQLKDKFPNLVHSKYFDFGGHLAALEIPDALYKDIIEFLRKVHENFGDNLVFS